MDIVDDVADRGVRERGFTLRCEGRTVPGVLWTPADQPARGLVVLGHGGGVHKRALGMPGQARSLVRHEGFAAVCIDAVGHGDRLADGDRAEAETIAALQARGVALDDPEFRAARRTDRPAIDEAAMDAMVADSTATIDSVLADIGDVPVGYAGFSMGSMFGTSIVAHEPRIRAAALGLSGIMAHGAMAPVADRLRRDAAAISCPVLFLVQSDDEAIARDGAYRQFDTFRSTHKRMHVNPGKHQHVPGDETPFIELFLASHLCGSSLRNLMTVDRTLPVEI